MVLLNVDRLSSENAICNNNNSIVTITIQQQYCNNNNCFRFFLFILYYLFSLRKSIYIVYICELMCLYLFFNQLIYNFYNFARWCIVKDTKVLNKQF